MRFLFVDRILTLTPAEYVTGVKFVTTDDYYLTRDSQGRPCFVPSLIGEAVGQLAAWNVMSYCDFKYRPVAGMVGTASLYRPAYPGEVILIESFVDSLDEKAVQYHGVARVGDEVIFRIDRALGPMLPMEDFIEQQQVRQQFAQIHRLGDLPQMSHAMNEQLFNDTDSIFPKMIQVSFDRVIASEPGESLSAEKLITGTAPYFPDHFPNNPVLPMTILLECKLQLAREFVRRAGFDSRYEVCEMHRIKMNAFIHPGDQVVTHITKKQHDDDGLVLRYRTEVNGKRVCLLDVLMKVKP